jgi:hypothetical protein
MDDFELLTGGKMLGDKLLIRNLEIKSPPLDDLGGRLVLPSGELAQITTGKPFRFLAYMEFLANPDSPRGNHYHKFKEEFLYIVKGRLYAIFEDVETGHRRNLTVSTGDLINIKPFCAHVYFAQEYTQGIEYSPGDLDLSDTYRHVISRGE